MSTSSETRRLRVLLVGNEEQDGARFGHLVAEMPGRVVLEWAGTFEAGLRAMSSGLYDVHLLDCRLDTRSGIDLLRAYRKSGGDAPVILIAGDPKRADDLAAEEAGAADYLVKDRLDGIALERSIRYAVEAS